MKLFEKFLLEQTILEEISHTNAKIKKLATKISGHTDDNYHTHAIMTLAKYLGDHDTHKELKSIDKRHMSSNQGISDKDDKRRNELRSELLNKVKNTHTPEQHKMLHNSF